MPAVVEAPVTAAATEDSPNELIRGSWIISSNVGFGEGGSVIGKGSKVGWVGEGEKVAGGDVAGCQGNSD